MTNVDEIKLECCGEATEDRDSRWLFRTITVVSTIILLRLRLGPSYGPGDDALMTFRTVKHLAEGHGFTYNLGEHVYCTTTALYTLILSLVCRVTGAEPVAAYLPFNVLFDLLNLALVCAIASRILSSRTWGALVGLCWSLDWLTGWSTQLGMESSFFLFLFLAATYAVECERIKRVAFWAALFSGLSVITRPEGVVIAFAILLVLAIRRRLIPTVELLIVLISVLPWVVYAFSTFGTIIPQSLIAKKLAYVLPAKTAMTALIVYFFKTLTAIVPFTSLLGVVVVGYLPIVVLGLYQVARKSDSGFVLVIYAVGCGIGYSVANPLMGPFPWYFVPLQPTYLLGLFYCVQRLTRKNGGLLPTRLLCNFVGTLLLLAQLGYQVTQYDLSWTVHRFLSFSDHWITNRPYPNRIVISQSQRERLYFEIVRELRPIVDAKTTILAPEFGVIGYYLPCRIISSIGHVNPEVMQYLPYSSEELADNNAIPVRMVKGLAPDYIVSLETFFRNSLTSDLWFAENYQVWKRYESRTFNSNGLYVFKRVS